MKKKEEKIFVFGKNSKVRIYLEGETLKHKEHSLILTEILGPMPVGYPVEVKNLPAYYLRCLTCEGPNRENGYKNIGYYNSDGSQR